RARAKLVHDSARARAARSTIKGGILGFRVRAVDGDDQRCRISTGGRRGGARFTPGPGSEPRKAVASCSVTRAQASIAAAEDTGAVDWAGAVEAVPSVARHKLVRQRTTPNGCHSDLEQSGTLL